MHEEGDAVDAPVAMECGGLYADCSENTRAFWAQGCHPAATEDKLLIYQSVGALSANVDPSGCLWAIAHYCGSVGRECGPEGPLIARESGPVLTVFGEPTCSCCWAATARVVAVEHSCDIWR
jgi:hypothetical protein